MDQGRADGDERRASTSTDVGGDLEPEYPAGPWQPASAVTDAVDSDLAEFRRRVVDPVVTSVLTPEELDFVVVFEERRYHGVRATVVARGEGSMHYLQLSRSLPAPEDDLAGIASQFASEPEDFVAESGFAWAEQRTARYAIPPDQPTGLP